MQPENNNADTTQNDIGAKVDTAVNTNDAPKPENVMTQGTSGNNSDNEKTKMSKKQIVGLVVLSLIAIGGVLFGVYGMNSQNDQIAQLTTRAENAEGKVASLETEKITITDPNGTTEITDSTSVSVASHQNPVIKSSDPNEEYTMWFKSSRYLYGVSDYKSLHIGIKDGSIYQCNIYKGSTKDEKSNEGSLESNCTIDGISGNIYKVIEFGAGQMNMGNQIGFIMTDGTIQYLPFYESMENNSFGIRGTLKTNGFITDAFDINIGVGAVGYAATVFVLDDGSYVKFDESML